LERASEAEAVREERKIRGHAASLFGWGGGGLMREILDKKEKTFDLDPLSRGKKKTAARDQRL